VAAGEPCGWDKIEHAEVAKDNRSFILESSWGLYWNWVGTILEPGGGVC
jgi:hypothetical protein